MVDDKGRRGRISRVKNCEIKVRNRSLDSRGDALGDQKEGLERVFRLWK